MIRPAVDVILSLVDKITGPLRGTSQGMKGIFADMAKSIVPVVDVGDMLRRGIGFVTETMQRSFQAADDYRVSLQKLEGTAKLTGAPLSLLNNLTDEATKKYGLSRAQAGDLAVEVAKLAAASGDVGKAGPLLKSFLDIGAARGLTAEQTLTAVKQAILGVDEGTDKLFNKNPSAIWKAYADALGTTVGKLSDMQKQQALMSAALIDGNKVAGAYSEWLETTAGKAQLAANAHESLYAKIGLVMDPMRAGYYEVKAAVMTFVESVITAAGETDGLTGAFKVTWATIKELAGGVWELVSGIGSLVAEIWNGLRVWEGLQIAITIVSTALQYLVNTANYAVGGIQLALGTLLSYAAPILDKIGISVGAAADRLMAKGSEMVQKAEKNYTDLGVQAMDRILMIAHRMGAEQEKSATQAEANVTAATAAGAEARAAITEAEAKKRAAALKKLEDETQKLIDQFRDDFGGMAPAALKKAEEAAKKVVEQIRALRDAGREVPPGLLMIQRQYEDQAEVAERLADLTERVREAEVDPGRIDSLLDINDLLDEANSLRIEAGEHTDNAKVAEEAIKALSEKRKKLLDQQADALEAALKPLQEQNDLWFEIAEHGEGAADNAGGLSDELVNAARGAVALAGEFLGLDEQTQNILNNAITLADTLSKGIGNLSTGDMVGAIGSLAGIIGGLFGPSPAEQARRALLAENTRALQKLRDSVGDLERTMSPGATIAAFQQVNEQGVLGRSFRFGGRDLLTPQAVAQELAKYGLTVGDMQRLADDMGLGQLRKDGEFYDAAVLKQFFDGLKDFEPNRVGQDFDSQRRYLDDYAEIAGLDPIEALKRQAALAGGQSSFLKNIFDSADLTTEAGRKDLRSRLQTVFGQLNTGEFDVGQFGKLNGQQFRDFISEFVSRLNGLEGTASDGSGGTGAPPPPTIDPPGTSVPAPPSVPTPAPPGGGAEIVRVDAAMMVGRLDTLVTQGGVMIELQTRIARAVEATAYGGATRPSTDGTGTEGDLSAALLADLELAEQTLGRAA